MDRMPHIMASPDEPGAVRGQDVALVRADSARSTAVAMPASVLPSLYAAWIGELLEGPIPEETRATCHACAMVREPGKSYAPQEIHYEPDLKCCTFYPELSNFSVGRILRDPVCVGRDEILHRIECGVRVTPLGIGRPPMYGVIYQQRSPETFGRSRRLRCSFLTPLGQCGIWEHRESICATYFCKFVRGAVGKRFWTELQRLLYVIERELALHCVLELDLGDQAMRRLFEESSDGRLDLDALAGSEPAEQRALRWGRYAGREQELYQEAAAMIDGLDWSQVLGICGPGARAHARVVRAAYQALQSQELPTRLRTGAFHMAHDAGGRTRLVGYSRLDALEVASEVVPALLQFDGRPTAEILAQLGDDAALDEAAMGTCVDFEILIPAEALLGGRSRS